jgi:hypothetical protein
MEALSLGWRPRGKKKQQGVPWLGAKGFICQEREAITLKLLPSKSAKTKRPIATDDTMNSMESADSKRKRCGRGEKDMHYRDEDDDEMYDSEVE